MLVLVVTCGPFAMAQGVLKPAAKAISKTATKTKTHHLPWEKAVRLGGFSYVKPNYLVGYEILNGNKNSFIGSDEHIRFERVAARTHFLGNDFSRFIAEQVVKPAEIPPQSFPGFYADFPRTWQHFTTHLGRLEVLLEAAYGESDQFSGHFVRSFDEVMELAISPVQYPLPARQALDRALREAQEVKAGFFVIRIAGNGHRPKDTLLLDLEHNQYISYNHSAGNRWADQVKTNRKLVEFMPVDEQQYPTAQDRRTTQGIILRVDGGNTPKTFAVSVNATNWQVYHLNVQEAFSTREAEDGINILTAWNKGYYIKQGRGRWLFAAGPGKPLFNTPKEVDEYLQKQEKLVRQEWIEHHPVEYVLAAYRANYFGDKLPDIMEVLTPAEQEAFTFSSSGLSLTDAQRIEDLRAAAIADWERQARRPATSCLRPGGMDYTNLLTQPSYHFQFVTNFAEVVPFLSLPYEQQVEELIWVWKTYGISPVVALPHLTGLQL